MDQTMEPAAERIQKTNVKVQTIAQRRHEVITLQSPSLLKRSWFTVRDVVKETETRVVNAQLFLTASSLAYTTLLSVIPVIAVSFAVFQIFGGTEKMYAIIEPFILSNLSGGASDEAMSTLQNFVKNAHASMIGVGGLVGLAITCTSVFSSVEEAINRVWDSEIHRTWLRRIGTYTLLITLGPLAAAVSLGLATSLNLPLARLFPGGTGIFLITAFLFTAGYKFIPDTPVATRYAAVSGTVIAAVFAVAQVIYHFVTLKFLSYGKIYGSLSVVPVMLLWIYISWLIILAGAALTASLQKMYVKQATP